MHVFNSKARTWTELTDVLECRPSACPAPRRNMGFAPMIGKDYILMFGGIGVWTIFVRVGGAFAYLACSTAQQKQHNASVNQKHVPFDALTFSPCHSMCIAQGSRARHPCKTHGSSTSETFTGCKWPHLHLCPGTLWGLQVCP